MSAGYYYTVAIRNDGTLWAWGQNDEGQLGKGNNNNGVSFPENYSPKQIGTATNWKTVSAGLTHTVAIRNDGTIWAWGYNNFGQLGKGNNDNGPSYEENYSPKQIGTATNWIAVSAGNNHTVVIRNDGTLWAWGYNAYGQLGKGDGYTANTFTSGNWEPKQIGTDTDWIAVAAGGDHTAAIRNDGTLWAWGSNAYGQLGKGDGYTANTFTSGNWEPEQIGTATNWIAVFTGSSHTVAIRNDGTLWAWGRNNFGQLGKGDGHEANTFASGNWEPVQIGTTNWESVSGGEYHTIALKRDGTLWAWGRNHYGQLGLGTGGDGTNVYDENSPKRLGEAADLVEVSAGLYHSTALRRSGILWAWGYNNNGQLGLGDENNRPRPTAVKWK